MRRTLPVVSCLLAVLAISAAGAEPTSQPNVLFILCDDLRPDALGC